MTDETKTPPRASGKHHQDKHGTYNMHEVLAITPAIERRDGGVVSKKAVLHFPGGGQLATNTDYDKLVASWKSDEPVASERKPVAVEESDDE